MSSLNIVSLDGLLIAGRAIVLVMAFAAFGWGFARWRKASERDAQRVFEQLDLVRADLLIMKEVMQSAAQRVDSAAKQVAHDVRLAPTQNSGTGRGYEIAARLARSGAPKEELIKSCGITIHEAELLIRLHGRSTSVPTEAIQTAPQTFSQAKIPVKTASSAAATTAAAKVAERIAEIGRSVRKPQSAPQAPAPVRSPQVKSRLVAVG